MQFALRENELGSIQDGEEIIVSYPLDGKEVRICSLSFVGTFI